jgi:hypothetical protein
VSRLIRVRYGPFILPSRLKRGRCLELTEEEVKKLEKILADSNSSQGSETSNQRTEVRGQQEPEMRSSAQRRRTQDAGRRAQDAESTRVLRKSAKKSSVDTVIKAKRHAKRG